MHALTWNDEDNLSNQKKADRITASRTGLREEERGTDFQTCRNCGLVESYYDYDLLANNTTFLNRHSCENAGGRCHKRRDKDSGELVCRVPKQKGFQKATFITVPVSNVFDDESANVLRELTDDKYLRVDHKGDLEFSTGEEAGRWQYESAPQFEGRTSTVIATVPLVAFFMESATNVAKVDPMFGPGYTTKYCGGSDEKPKVVFQGRDPSTVEAQEKPLENLKITGQRIITEQEANKKPVPLIRRVALTDICFDMMKLPYVCSTENFRHYSNKFPEHRHAIRKYGNTGKFVFIDMPYINLLILPLT